MPVLVQCSNPTCRKSAGVPEQHLGKPVRCPHCGQTFQAVTSASAGADDATVRGVDQPVPDPQPDAPPNPGAPLQIARFRIRGRLGVGAFGAVHRAYDPQLDREVALKVPKSEALRNPKAVERFLREARSAAKLRHPNIVPVYDAGQDGSHYYIASAFIEGRTLAHAIAEGKRNLLQGVWIVRQLADALAHAHW